MSNCPVYVNESYEPKRIEALYQCVLAKSQSDKPQYYSIFVDDIPVVEKSTKPELFFDYSEFIDENTKQIKIFLFQSFQCRAANKYFFNLKPIQEKSKGLNGIDSPRTNIELESEEVTKERWRKELHYEHLLQENEELRAEIEDLNKALELAETAKEDIKQNRDLEFSGMIGMALNGLLKTDFVKNKLSIFDGFSGTKSQSQTSAQETENNGTFKRKTSLPNDPEDVESEEVKNETVSGQELSEQEMAFLQTLMEIKVRVGQAELKNVFHLIDLVTQNAQAIPFAIKHVTNYLKQLNNQPMKNKSESPMNTFNNASPDNYQNTDYSATLKNAGIESIGDTAN